MRCVSFGTFDFEASLVINNNTTYLFVFSFSDFGTNFVHRDGQNGLPPKRHHIFLSFFSPVLGLPHAILHPSS